MTGVQFCRWLIRMIDGGVAHNESECARRLGLDPRNLGRYKRRGGDHRLALACAALLHGIKPFS